MCHQWTRVSYKPPGNQWKVHFFLLFSCKVNSVTCDKTLTFPKKKLEFPIKSDLNSQNVLKSARGTLLKKKNQNNTTFIKESTSTFLMRTRPYVSEYFWIRNCFFPDTVSSTRIRRNRQQIRIFLNSFSKVKQNKFATNPTTCGRLLSNPMTFENRVHFLVK